MKKIIAMLLSCAMLLSLVACGGTAEAPEKNDAGADAGTSVDKQGQVVTNYDAGEVKTDKEMPPYKILVSYYSFTDKLGSQYKSSLEYLGKALNIEFTFIETGTGEDSMAIVESALVNKPDAYISNACSVADVKAAYDAGNIPYVACGTIFPSEEVAKEMAGYENFMGCIAVDDFLAGYSAGEALFEDGCRNVLLCSLQKGLSGQHDVRAAGFLESIKTHPEMKLLGEDYSILAYSEAITSYAATYPELDGVFCTAVSEAVYNTFATEDLIGSVRLGGLDVSESTGEYFDNGVLSYMAAGNYVTNMLGFVVVYNYLLDGTRLVENPTEVVMWNNINLRTSDDYNNYVKYLDSGTPAYTADEVMNMVHYYNENFTPQAFLELGKAFTLEDVMARHEAG